MDTLKIIRQVIAAFCVEFVNHPYLCYTEHGQHALFYTMLYSAIPKDKRYATWKGQKVCILQKEYPTAANLGKPQRQHWDVGVLSEPLSCGASGTETYDYLRLLAAIEFGMNESQEHLMDDIERLGHNNANIVQGFIVHFYRLSAAGKKFSGRDWSPSSTRILSPEKVRDLSLRTAVEIYYGLADSTGKHENGVWYIQDGQISRIELATPEVHRHG